MRAYLPVILVVLALFTAGCIAYIAWELSSGDSGNNMSDEKPPDAD